MSHCHDYHQTCKDLPEGWFQEFTIFLWPWHRQRRRYRFVYPWYLLNQLMTKFAWIYHWDKLKSWLGFGNLDLIFKVTGGLTWQTLVPTISHEPVDDIQPPNMPEYIFGTSLRADLIFKVTGGFRYMKFSLKNELSNEPDSWLPPDLQRFTWRMVPRVYYIFVTLTLFSRSKAN